MEIADLVDDILVEVPYALEDTLERSVKLAVMDFYEASEAWRHQLRIPVEAGCTKYTLALPANTRPIALAFVYAEKDDGERYRLASSLPQRVNSKTGAWPREFALQGLELMVDGDNAVAFEVEVILSPTRTITEIPDLVVDPHVEALRYGALARLLSMPGKEWTDKGTAGHYSQLYVGGVLKAKRMARKDRHRPARQVRYGGL